MVQAAKHRSPNTSRTTTTTKDIEVGGGGGPGSISDDKKRREPRGVSTTAFISIIITTGLVLLAIFQSIEHQHSSLSSSLASSLQLALSTTQNDADADNIDRKNHIEASHVAAHVQALNDAMTPGRGYHPSSKERASDPLPEIKGSYWWLNNCGQGSVPEAFGIAALDMTYPKDYFYGGGHPNGHGWTDLNYIKYINRYASLFLGRDVDSLVEFGNGGGVYAETFQKLYSSDKFVTVEGTGAGYEKTLNRGVPKEQVVQHDLRHPIYLGRRFDVAVCTEVVEHVEPPFSSQIVLSLVLHADIVWFSFKPVGLKNGAWINHPNERPFEFWSNLFDFYGYEVVKFDHRMHPALYYRGDFIAYKRDSDLKKISQDDLKSNLDEDILNPPEKPQSVTFVPCKDAGGDQSKVAWTGPSGMCALYI